VNLLYNLEDAIESSLHNLFGTWYRTGTWPNGMPFWTSFWTRRGALNMEAPKNSVYDLHLRGPVVFVPGKVLRRRNRTA